MPFSRVCDFDFKNIASGYINLTASNKIIPKNALEYIPDDVVDNKSHW